jgi:hypothetical protein
MSDKVAEEAAQAATAAVNAADAESVDDDEELSSVVKLNNGITVRVKPLPDLLVQRLYTQYDMPEPPMVEVESNGKTWEEKNYNDPAYQDEVTRYTMRIAAGITNLMLLRGFEVLEKPDHIPDYEDDDTWELELELVGVDIPSDTHRKRLMWREYRLLENSYNMDLVQTRSQKLSGVSEEDIVRAQERFRGLTGQLSDRGVDDEEERSSVQS